MGFLSSPGIETPPPAPMAPTYASTDVQAGAASSAQKRAKAAAGLASTTKKTEGVGSTTTAQKQLVGE